LETFFHGVAFVFGFSLVFLTLGLALSAVGSLLYDLRVWIARLGGIIVVLLGLHMTGLLRIQWLEYDLRPRTPLDQRRSLLSSIFLGISFSAGWSPCIGPVLGMILTLAINQGSVVNGLFLLAMYSLGLAIPFLVAALGIGWVVTILRRYQKVMHYVEIAMGVIMIGVGVLLFLGIFNQLAQFGFFVDLGL
jgi:cytochrome c-type biogenesis protein